MSFFGNEKVLAQLFATVSPEETQLILSSIQIVTLMVQSATIATGSPNSFLPSSCSSVEMLSPASENTKFPINKKGAPVQSKTIQKVVLELYKHPVVNVA